MQVVNLLKLLFPKYFSLYYLFSLLKSIASTGQIAWQVPQDMQSFLSICALPFLSKDIALTGQLLTQAPHPIHLFLSTIFSPFVYY